MLWCRSPHSTTDQDDKPNTGSAFACCVCAVCRLVPWEHSMSLFWLRPSYFDMCNYQYMCFVNANRTYSSIAWMHVMQLPQLLQVTALPLSIVHFNVPWTKVNIPQRCLKFVLSHFQVSSCNRWFAIVHALSGNQPCTLHVPNLQNKLHFCVQMLQR